jgi:hypothetical protein
MVALLIACLVSAPANCRSVEILLIEAMPIPQAIEAQTRAAEWLGQHPGMTMKSLIIVVGKGA